jgi:hypothetical protein
MHQISQADIVRLSDNGGSHCAGSERAPQAPERCEP